MGAILGAAGGSLLRSPTAAAESLVGRGVQGVTPQQWQQAETLIQNGRGIGVDITMPEAIQQVTNGGTNLAALQRFAENSPQSADRMAAFMAPRAGQVRQAGENFFDTLAPATDTPSVLGMNLQRAGRNAIGEVQGERTAATRPHYQATNGQAVPQPDMEAILRDIQQHAGADQTGLLGGPLAELRQSLVAAPGQPGTPATRTPVMGPNGQVIRYQTTPATPQTPEVPITNIENLDRARKYWRDRIDAPQNAPRMAPPKISQPVRSPFLKVISSMAAQKARAFSLNADSEGIPKSRH
jgi:hypothetical protein